MRIFLRLLRYILILGVSGVLLACLAVGVAYWLIAPRLPSVETLRDVRLQVPLRVYSADSKLIATIGETRRIPIKIEQVPPQLKNAFLAAEDANFYSHPGVDWQGVARAVGLMISKRTMHVPGGSTITQQVARGFFLSSEVSLTRKFTEIFLSFRIERELTKDEIFELYLNKIFFGNRAYGVAAAAEFYYGKTLDQLTLAESAMLASLPKFPSSSNPLSNRARATERRKYVLQRMLDNGFITADQFKQADAEPDRSYAHEPPIEVEAPWIAEMVRQDVLDKLGNEALTDGYSVYTTLDATRSGRRQSSAPRRSDRLRSAPRLPRTGSACRSTRTSASRGSRQGSRRISFRRRIDSWHRHRERGQNRGGLFTGRPNRSTGHARRRVGGQVQRRAASRRPTEKSDGRPANGRHRSPRAQRRGQVETVPSADGARRADRARSGRRRHQSRSRRIQFLAQQVQSRGAVGAPTRFKLQAVLLFGGFRARLHARIDHQRRADRLRRPIQAERIVDAAKRRRKIRWSDAPARGDGRVQEPRIRAAARRHRRALRARVRHALRFYAGTDSRQPFDGARNGVRVSIDDGARIRCFRERRVSRRSIFHRPHRRSRRSGSFQIATGRRVPALSATTGGGRARTSAGRHQNRFARDRR